MLATDSPLYNKRKCNSYIILWFWRLLIFEIQSIHILTERQTSGLTDPTALLNLDFYNLINIFAVIRTEYNTIIWSKCSSFNSIMTFTSHDLWRKIGYFKALQKSVFLKKTYQFLYNSPHMVQNHSYFFFLFEM